MKLSPVSNSWSSMHLQELVEVSRHGLDPEPMLELAYRLFRGSRCDVASAVTWLHDAAALGSAEAMYNLALCYLCGRGVQRSLARSRKWTARCERLIEGSFAPASGRVGIAQAPRVCSNARARGSPPVPQGHRIKNLDHPGKLRI